ncbi:MAG: murein biosynthesis integral membrane protein MurJ [Hyphomicrobiaceae bacterium]|nr:murein biosynthesis integral membrane protein MurJ [Hyphomicrobiaceae bacterium]
MKLYQSFATVGGMTMLSRVLGFVRDVMIASVLGTGPVADAFFVAFRFPNLFRRLFAEGAFNAAFVPLFARKLEGEGKGAARQFAQEALAGMTAILMVFTALAELTMPGLMYAFAPGFYATPDKFDLTVQLTRIAFPYLFCVSLVALFSGVLNALGKFALAAFAPVLLNIVFIIVLGGLAIAGTRGTADAGVALAWAVFVGGFAQLGALLIGVRGTGLGLKLQRPRWTDGTRKLVRLGIPGLIAGGITQINIWIGTIIASLQDSAVSWLYYADRVYQLPLGIVGIAVGVVLLPNLSRDLRAGNHTDALESMNRSLEFSMFFTLPAAAALFAAPQPIIQVLFERGAFTDTDTPATALALAAFAAGLPAFVAIKVFSPGFFARENTKTPMIYATISVAVNVVGSLSLFFIIGHVGIAIATSLAGWVNTVLLAGTLLKRGEFAFDAQFKRRIGPLCFSSVVMGFAVWLLAWLLAPYFAPSQGILFQVGALGLLVATGLIVYLALAHLTGGADVRGLLRRILGL